MFFSSDTGLQSRVIMDKSKDEEEEKFTVRIFEGKLWLQNVEFAPVVKVL